ncbi:chemotaxis protein CheW [Paraliomyxa miuraensis]|uniref:chemotaxis protein CheW n=1 Tax=Paraliomyxa miuraensis TaxID=376150 RepID=UPI002254D635|nr:chemotaxis protein CheW [Paraliomyxa miuraensis]MCX4245790.1 chemotaxis protein CheW [Paraliomyxa miuraensis]
MARESNDLWGSLAGGETMATEEDYEHGYKREVRQDLEQYVAFKVSGECYGLSISQISEISKVFDTTPVPRTSDFVIGIGNVRGSVIPIIDLALRLRLRPRPLSRDARILIVRHEDELYGLRVDEVLYVVTIAPEELEEAPGAIAGARGEYIKALTRLDDDILIVLELSTVLVARDFVRAELRPRAFTSTKGGRV